MLPHLLCNITRAHRIYRQPHGEQSVRILAECFTIEEIAPAAKHLAVQSAIAMVSRI